MGDEVEGEACPCMQGDWRVRPPHVCQPVPGGWWDRVDVETCSACGATWLSCFYEDHYGNGSWYRGLIDASVEVDGARCEAMFAAMPWYLEGGTYIFGEIVRTRGPIRRR